MHNFRVVCFLTVSFWLVVCVSGNTEVTAEVAKLAVDDAKTTVTTARDNAQKHLDSVNLLVKKVDASKNEAAQASSQAKEAAKDTPKAESIVNKVTEFAQAVATSYPEAQKKLQNAVKSLTSLLDEAKELESEPEIEISHKDGSKTDYTEENNKAKDLKRKAEDLNGRITEALQLFTGVDTTADSMAEKAKETQLGEAHVVAIVAVAKIDTMLGRADTIIEKIQSKNNDVNLLVQDIKTHFKKDLIDSNKILQEQCNSADNLLTSAKGAVEEAKTVKGKIEQQKGLAEAALTNVQKSETIVTTAQQEANKAKVCVTTAEDLFQQLNHALQTVETCLTTANGLKREIQTAPSKATSEQNTQQSKETAQSVSPVRQSTEPAQKDTTIQPKSKDLPDQSDNSADKLKGALIKGAQNIPTSALTGKKAPAPGANNDSAMTVSVPLLVALIASAVWQ